MNIVDGVEWRIPVIILLLGVVLLLTPVQVRAITLSLEYIFLHTDLNNTLIQKCINLIRLPLFFILCWAWIFLTLELMGEFPGDHVLYVIMYLIIACIGLFTFLRLLEVFQQIMLNILHQQLSDPLLIDYVANIRSFLLLVVAVVVVAVLFALILNSARLSWDGFANILVLGIMLCLSDSLCNFLGISVAMVDRNFDYGHIIEIAGFHGRAFCIKSQHLLIRNPGSGTCRIPGRLFLTHPYVNHSKRTFVDTWINIPLDIPDARLSVEVPKVKFAVEKHLTTHCLKITGSIKVFMRGERLVVPIRKLDANKICAPSWYATMPTLGVRLTTKHDMNMPDFMRFKSELLLSLMEICKEYDLEIC